MSLFSTSYIFVNDKEASPPYHTVRGLVDAGARKVRAPGRKYAVGLDTHVGRMREFDEAKERARQLVKKFPEHKVLFRAFGSDDSRLDQVRFVTLSKTPPLANTPGVEGIDRIVGWIESEVKLGRLTSRRYAGICVCKNTSSGGHSDHADCAAIDIFANDEDMRRINHVVVTEHDYFHTKYAILYNTIYFPESSKPYPGNYHWHNHISVTGGVFNAAC